MDIVILLYEGMTALDAIGPYEVLAQLPGAQVRFAAAARGVVRTDTRALGLVADHAVADVSSADVLVVPGGPGDALVRATPRLLDWVRTIHETTQWTTSVCSGALILGAAGLLRGLEATTHWMVRDTLREFGALPVAERVVERGKIITAAGVSAGIDMALAVVERAGAPDRVVFSSFDRESLVRLRARSDTASLAVLWHGRRLDAALPLAERVGARALHVRKDRVSPEGVLRAARAGLTVRAWTVNDPADFARLGSAGASGVFTDFPERFLHTPSL